MRRAADPAPRHRAGRGRAPHPEGVDASVSPLQLAVAATGFAALLMVILGGVVLLRRAYHAAHGHEDEQVEDPLQALRAAYEAGHMDDAEFRRVLASLGREADYAILRKRGPGAAPMVEPKPDAGKALDENWP